jgi:hypothetical protein
MICYGIGENVSIEPSSNISPLSQLQIYLRSLLFARESVPALSDTASLISGGLDLCRVIVKCSFPFTPFTHFIFLLASAFSGYRLSLSFLSLLAWFFGTQGRITRVLTACIAPRTLGLESSDPFPTTPNTAYSNRAGHLMS